MTKLNLNTILAAMCCAPLAIAGADTTVFFNSGQVATPVSSGVTSETFSSNGYLFTCTRDKLFTGGTGTIIGRTVRIPWPTGVEAQAVTTPPPGVTDYKARITLKRVDGGVFDMTAITFKLLANTAGAGGTLEIMPKLNGEDAFNDPVYFDATGYYGMTFSYNETLNPWGSTSLLKGYDTYNIGLYVDFAFTGLTLATPPVPCPADLGQQGGLSGGDGLLDNNDFIVFIDDFFNANALADVGVQGGLHGSDGLFDNNDFIAFIDLFFAGC